MRHLKLEKEAALEVHHVLEGYMYFGYTKTQTQIQVLDLLR